MPTTNWTIDASHSEIHFSVRHLVIAKVRGEFTSFNGTLELDLTKSKVDVSIDVASVSSSGDKRDAHLRSRDFFDAEKFPTAAFKSTSVPEPHFEHPSKAFPSNKEHIHILVFRVIRADEGGSTGCRRRRSPHRCAIVSYLEQHSSWRNEIFSVSMRLRFRSKGCSKHPSQCGFVAKPWPRLEPSSQCVHGSWEKAESGVRRSSRSR